MPHDAATLFFWRVWVYRYIVGLGTSQDFKCAELDAQEHHAARQPQMPVSGLVIAVASAPRGRCCCCYCGICAATLVCGCYRVAAWKHVVSEFIWRDISP
jgi:hypothetical protein